MRILRRGAGAVHGKPCLLGASRTLFATVSARRARLTKSWRAGQILMAGVRGLDVPPPPPSWSGPWHFRELGLAPAEAVMTDGARCYRTAALFRRALAAAGARPP
jgi:hypothetical protein